MVEAFPGRPAPTYPARIRELLARASEQGAVERFWSLAVAQQLIEEGSVGLCGDGPPGRK